MNYFSKFSVLLLLFSLDCNGQANENYNLLGGPCEGCEGILEYGTRKLLPVDTLPDFFKYQSKLEITGTVYQPDAKTPAPNVILYIYHTNPNGIYPTRGDEIGWGRRHGYIRGWVKTGNDGTYRFLTHLPGSYASNPAHIHPTILEPDGSYYYIDEFHFEGDPHLSDAKDPKPRGGNGTVQLNKIDKNYFLVERDIILGLNVPNYKLKKD